MGAEEGRHGQARGFSPGDVVLIRGEPGTGKTTLALQIASNLFAREPNSIIRYVSLEESRTQRQMTLRILHR